MSIVIFVYWVLDVPATFITGYDRGGILEMRLRHIAENYLKGHSSALRCLDLARLAHVGRRGP